MKRLIMVIPILITFLSLANTTHAQQGNNCNRALEPHLKAGDRAQILKATTPDLPGAFLKGQPGHPNAVLRYLPIGTVVEVLDGPECGDDGGYWWNITVGGLTGWLAEASGKEYALEVAPADAASNPLPSTVTQALPCIKPPVPRPPSTPFASDINLRMAYATFDGKLMVSDNASTGRQVTMFDPAPRTVDLAPDGTSALVTNYNGIYWVDLTTGQTVLVADSQLFGLQEGMWVSRADWLPDGRIAVEVTDSRESSVAYNLWIMALDGKTPAFPADTGAQPHDSIQRSPTRSQAVIISANSILPFPLSLHDETPGFLDYIPKIGEGNADQLVIPALSWDMQNKGFYTFIPLSDDAGPDDQANGHLWYISMNGTATDLGKLPKIKANDYVIAAPDGKTIILGRGKNWEMRSVETGAILQTLPPVQFLFGYTPDGSGAVFTDQNAQAQFLGVDGSTISPYVPSITNLYEIKWLPDGSVAFGARGKDGKISFSLQRPGAEPKFLGIIATVHSYSGLILGTKPGPGVAPESCAPTAATPAPPAAQ